MNSIQSPKFGSLMIEYNPKPQEGEKRVRLFRTCDARGDENRTAVLVGVWVDEVDRPILKTSILPGL